MNAGSTLPPPECFHVSAAAGWLELGSPREARDELKSLSIPHQDHPDALEVWWKIFAAEDDWPSALACGEKLAALAPERASAWINLSFALHELGRTREAFDRLQSAAGQFSDDFVIPYNLACYQCRLGNEASAWSWLERAAQTADPRLIRSMALEDPDLAALREKVLRLV